jgi:hypothetical protein
MTLDDRSTGLLDLHLSPVEEAPHRQLRTGWVLGGALALVAVVAGLGIAAVVPHKSSAPAHVSSSAAAPSTPDAAAPAPSAGGVATGPGTGPVVAQAALQRAGHPAGLLTVGTGKLVMGQAPPLVNFRSCGTDDRQLEYLPVEIREAVGGLAAAVTVQPGPTTPPGIGRLGFFFESHDGNAFPCRDGAAWPTTDTFEAVSGARLITGYVVLDSAVTAVTPQGRSDVFSSLQLKISHLRQFDDYVPRSLDVDAPTVGQLCPGDQAAVCAPLG